MAAGDGDPLRRVRPGEDFEFLAQTYNLLMGLLSKDKRGQGAIFEGAIAQGFDTSIIQVKNNTAGNVPRFSVLGLNGTIIDPTSDHIEGFQDRVVLLGRTPSLPEDAGRWAILLQPLAIDEIGYAVVNGACPVQLEILDATDTFAEAIDSDSTKLTSSGDSGGASILYKESGTGLKWAVVRVGNPSGIFKGEFDGMLYGMVSDNEAGFSFPRVVNVPPGF